MFSIELKCQECGDKFDSRLFADSDKICEACYIHKNENNEGKENEIKEKQKQ